MILAILAATALSVWVLAWQGAPLPLMWALMGLAGLGMLVEAMVQYGHHRLRLRRLQLGLDRNPWEDAGLVGPADCLIADDPTERTTSTEQSAGAAHFRARPIRDTPQA